MSYQYVEKRFLRNMSEDGSKMSDNSHDVIIPKCLSQKSEFRKSKKLVETAVQQAF